MITIYKSLSDKNKKKEDLDYLPLEIDSKEEAAKETVIFATVENIRLLQALEDIRKEVRDPARGAKLLSQFTPEQLKALQKALGGKADPSEEEIMDMLSNGLITVEQINELTAASKGEWRPTVEQLLSITDEILKVLNIVDVNLNTRQRRHLLDLTIENEYNFF